MSTELTTSERTEVTCGRIERWVKDDDSDNDVGWIISKLDSLGSSSPHLQSVGVHAYSAFPLTRRVKEGRLNAYHGSIEHGLIVHEVEAHASVGGDVGQSQQVLPPDAKVSVKVWDSHAPRAANPHDSLKGSAPR